ncbi:DUF397 domain-containing protein [Promicromonospora thailandica]|uniref:DUF397 domain-containing protein n=1 Tax=Promicromonospora thailandica TaxID=765201 RepID=UPI0020A5198F|nr:DUF397 domain-containing protein [Promicromonospora thailandica]
MESAEVVFVDGDDVPVTHKHAEYMVVLRDADDPDGVALYYTPDEWEAFVLGVKDSEFDDLAEIAAVPPTDAPERPAEDGAAPERTFPWTGRPGLFEGSRTQS